MNCCDIAHNSVVILMEGEKRGVVATTKAEVMPVALHYQQYSWGVHGRNQVLILYSSHS
jgi:hypothetical protein